MNVIIQSKDTECGIASLAMVLNHLGKEYTLYQLREKAKVFGEDGMSALDIINLAESEQLSAQAFSLSGEHIDEVELPAIAHWNDNHFVVISKVTDKSVTVHDPALGKVNYPRSQFCRLFSGTAIEFEKTVEFTPFKQKTKSPFWGFALQYENLSKGMLSVISMTLIYQILMVISPLFNQVLIDKVLPNYSSSFIVSFGFGFALLMIFRFFTEITSQKMENHLSLNIEGDFRERFTKKLYNLSSLFVEQRSKSEIISKFDSLNAVNQLIFRGSIETMFHAVSFTLSLAFAYYINPILLLIYLGFFGASVLLKMKAAVNIELKKRITIENKINEDNLLLEIINTFELIKYSAKENVVYEKWEKLNREYLKSSANLQNTNDLITGLVNLIMSIKYVIISCIALYLVSENSLTIGAMFTFLFYTMSLDTSGSSIVNLAFEFKLLKVNFEKVNDLLLEKDEFANVIPSTTPFTFNKQIRLENISYTIQGHDKPLLTNINLTINKGESVVITGASGRGKTTLLKIISGNLRPTSGTIYIDDKPLLEEDLKEYRKAQSIILQGEGQIFSGSIIDNLTLFEKSPDIEKAIAACDAALLHEDIVNKKMSYETLIAPTKNNLSGGQKQRLLIARALYMNSNIILMDEATSALDQDTEKKIMKRMKEINITKIAVAHRTETIKLADKEYSLN